MPSPAKYSELVDQCFIFDKARWIGRTILKLFCFRSYKNENSVLLYVDRCSNLHSIYTRSGAAREPVFHSSTKLSDAYGGDADLMRHQTLYYFIRDFFLKQHCIL